MNNSYNERSMKIIDLKKTVLEDNDVDADRLREELKKKNVFYMNVMSSPGSGKTTTIVGTIERLRKHFNIGVMEADIDSSVDAEKMALIRMLMHLLLLRQECQQYSCTQEECVILMLICQDREWLR